MFPEIDEIVLMSSYKFLMQKEYWINQLAGDVDVMDLAVDDGKSPEPPLDVERIDMCIPGDISCKLLKLSKKSDTSLYIVLLAALKSLIYCYSAHEDIIVISPLYKFNVTEETINQRLFIRTKVRGDMTFKELLLNVRDHTLKAYENQDYPSHKLLEYLYNTREIQDIGRVIYNNILCALENIHDTGEVEKIINRLTFSFLREEEQVRGGILYEPSVYKRDYIEQIACHFVRVLEQATNYIEIEIADIEFLSGQEKKILLDDFNCTEAELPHYKTVYEMFTEQVKKNPGNSAVVYEGSPGERSQLPSHPLTYAELNEQANSLASVLKEKGVGPNTIVPLMVEPSREMLIGIIGILKAGACFLPIDSEFPSKRIEFMMEDTGAGILLTQSHLSGKVDFSGEILIINENLHRENISNLEDGGDSKNPLYIIYTSGTTGKPKGVLITNSNLINYVHWFNSKVNLIPADKTILTSSFAFDLGYTVLFSSLLSGCQLHLLCKDAYLSVKRLVKYIEEKEITYLKFTPSLFTYIVNSAECLPDRLKSLRLVVLGGEAIDLKDVEKAHVICPHMEIMNHYGPTEATIGSIARFIDFKRFEDYKKNPTIGKPINNSHAYILGKHLKLLPVGIPGELYIEGACLATGYLNRPQLTAEKFIENPYKTKERIYSTGDLSRWRPDGNIEFLGRIDHQVKIRGFRIELQEIEKRLMKHEKIKEALVSVKQGEEKDKYLCAYIVADPSVPEEKLNIPEIKEFLAEELSGAMIPSYFVQIYSIPLTPNGKVNRKALPEPERGNTSGTYNSPRNDIETKLVEIWSDILKIDKEHISIDDNFFEVGGHSLKVIRLLSRIHKALDIEIPINQVFQNPTIRGLSTCMAQLQENEFSFLEKVEEKEYYLLSSAQKRLFILQHMNLEGTAYNMPAAVVMAGKLEREKLEHAFLQLINRHESLRTSFEIIKQEPVQRIHRDITFALEAHDRRDGKSGTGTRDGEEKMIDSFIKSFIKSFIRPFDLSEVPLLRAALVETGRDRNILIIDMHHIISDGLSVGIFIKEFTELYGDKSLPLLRVQYKEYSQWYNRSARRELIKEQETYWLKQFEGDIPVLNLPTDYSRPSIQSYEGDNINFHISPEETRALKKLALEEKATMFMVLLAVYNVLLSKLSGQEDIVVGTVIAGRNHVDLEKIMGVFVNVLTLRNFPAGEKTFIELLGEVRKISLQSFANQDYPFENLVERVVGNRDLSQHPLYNAAFTLNNLEERRGLPGGLTVPGSPCLKIQLHEYRRKVAKIDLNLMGFEEGEQLHLTLEYCAKLFKEATVLRFIDYFKTIVADVIKNPRKKIKEIEVISEEEKNQFCTGIQEDREAVQIDFAL